MRCLTVASTVLCRLAAAPSAPVADGRTTPVGKSGVLAQLSMKVDGEYVIVTVQQHMTYVHIAVRNTTQPGSLQLSYAVHTPPCQRYRAVRPQRVHRSHGTDACVALLTSSIVLASHTGL